jgi:ABC-type multidrug transport system ATPase subunit
VRAGGGDAKEVRPSLERLGLGGRLARTPAGRLSAGQRRRVGLAVLAARRLPLWLLDEPHAGLDSEARALLSQMVEDAARDGTSVLLVSHEPSVCAPLADRLVRMSGGRIVATEPARVTTQAPVAVPAARVVRGGAHVA